MHTPGSGEAAITDLWINDGDGWPVPADRARTQVRAAFGECTDAQLESNAAGLVHPSQTDRVRRYVRRQRGIAVLLMGSLTATVGGLATAAALSWPDQRTALIAWGAVLTAVPVGIAAWWVRRISPTRVSTIRGRLRSAGPGSGAPTGLGSLPTRVPLQWIGQPIVVHLIAGGASGPLYLSGDLDLPNVHAVPAPELPTPGLPALDVTTRVAPTSSPAMPPLRRVPPGEPDEHGDALEPPEIVGPDRLSDYLLKLAVAGGSTALVVWTVAATHKVPDLVALWATCSFLALLLYALQSVSAVGQRGRRYRLVVDAERQLHLLVVHRGATVARYPLAELTRVSCDGRVEDRDTCWRLTFGNRDVRVCGEPGQDLARRVRFHRRDLPVIGPHGGRHTRDP